jgi:hypothetical protein
MNFASKFANWSKLQERKGENSLQEKTLIPT